MGEEMNIFHIFVPAHTGLTLSFHFSIYSRRAGLLCDRELPKCSIQDLDCISDGVDNATVVRALFKADSQLGKRQSILETPSEGGGKTAAPKTAANPRSRDALKI